MIFSNISKFMLRLLIGIVISTLLLSSLSDVVSAADDTTVLPGSGNIQATDVINTGSLLIQAWFNEGRKHINK